MREILFRGKHKASGKWCEGNLNIGKQGVAIITPDDTPLGCYGQVDPETVGQYTGLNDKNRKKIFEGDIVAQPVCTYTVEYDGGAFFLAPIPEHNPYVCPSLLIGSGGMFEVIGNIHDNPELLKGGVQHDEY